MGLTLEGQKLLLGLQLGSRESCESWLDFGRDLKARGMRAPALIIADGTPGIWKATRELWPAAIEQRCAVHGLRNITSKLPERLHREVKARYWAILDEADSARDAKAGLLALAGDYRRAYPSAMKTIDDHADQLVAHLRFPAEPASARGARTCSSAPSLRSVGAPRSSAASPARPRHCRLSGPCSSSPAAAGAASR